MSCSISKTDTRHSASLAPLSEGSQVWSIPTTSQPSDSSPRRGEPELPHELTAQDIGHKKSPARNIRARDRKQRKTAADYRRSAITWAASATGTATELPPSRSRTSMVPLLTVSRPATAISGTPISSASLNLTPGDTFLRSS